MTVPPTATAATSAASGGAPPASAATVPPGSTSACCWAAAYSSIRPQRSSAGAVHGCTPPLGYSQNDENVILLKLSLHPC